MSGNTRSFTARKGEKARNLAALRRACVQWRQNDDVFSRLQRRLATTLSLETLIGLFADEVMSLVPFDHLIYRHQIGTQEFIYASGMGGPHRCDYKLTLEGINYGGLTLSRRVRFAEEELEMLEQLLGVAICPIRNACQYASVQQAALTDSLTGIPNKRALDEALARECSRGDRHGDTCTLILCDLDHFKQINDNHGHVVGDHILKAVAQELRKATRNCDELYRFGGEEFAIVLPHTDQDQAHQVAERIREFIATIRVNCGETDVCTSASFGLAMRFRDENPDQWVARADHTLYGAKRAGRNCTRVADAIGASPKS